jgi:hypothetical protein
VFGRARVPLARDLTWEHIILATPDDVAAFAVMFVTAYARTTSPRLLAQILENFASHLDELAAAQSNEAARSMARKTVRALMKRDVEARRPQRDSLSAEISPAICLNAFTRSAWEDAL